VSPIAELILAVAALLIGVSKAGFGGGTGVLVGPLLMLLYPAKESVALMLPLLFACDVASLFPYWGKWDRRNVIVLTPGAFAGIAVGTYALGAVSDALLAKLIGGIAIAFGVLQVYRSWVARSETPLTPNFWHGTLVGFATGFVSTLSHVGGVLTTMYLLTQRLDGERFVGTTTAVYFLVNLGKLPAYLKLGMLDAAVFWQDLPFFPVVFLGTALGVYLNRRVPGAWFARIVLVFVLITGVKLLLS
jgi:uncharacterized membrane protein YfcA